MEPDREQAGLAWQVGVWSRISDIYLRQIDRRFTPVVERVLARAQLMPGEHVLDLGTGTGAVAERAAQAVGPAGSVVGIDISPDMLQVARQRMAAGGLRELRGRVARPRGRHHGAAPARAAAGGEGGRHGGDVSAG